MENKLILNKIQTPDGTILISRHQHDFVSHTDKNGFFYFVDGGNEYQRVSHNPEAPHIDLSLYSDSPFELIRQNYCRGGRGKDGTEPLKWVCLAEMSDAWLQSAFDYNLERGLGEYFANKMYALEQDFRKLKNIKVDE